jgi:hypothetical protein
MPQYIEKHARQQVLGIPEERIFALTQWLDQEIEDTLSSRSTLDSLIRECLKMYNGVPKLTVRNVPIPNAPNIEITIGAIAADTIYAQAIDLIFNTSPLVTCRAKPKYKDDAEAIAEAKAMQRWVNHIASSADTNLRDATDTAILDDIQLGTSVLYIPFVQRTKKTKIAKVLSAGPRFYAVPIEDTIITPGYNIQDAPLFGMRFNYTHQELASIARDNKWNLDGIQPLHAKNWVRTTRETLGRQTEPLNRRGELYDIIHCYAYFDIDGDGYDEDLFIAWNHSGRKICYVNFNSMDHRPAEKMEYQKQPHLFYGKGVLEMLKPFEEKLSDVHNYATLNILLANSRIFVGSENSMSESTVIYPGKFIPVGDASKDFDAFAMADVYNSIWQDQLLTMQLANQRVGINEVSQGSQIPSRTPGITAMSFLQQVNRRFTPAFDSMKNCIGAALRQACYRYQERLKSGDQRVMITIYEVLGPADGNRVIDVLRRDSFDEHVDVELTAASASINREADRQNAIMLTNILGQYYSRTIELIMLAANPQTPPEVAGVARKIADAAGEIIDRTIRTFDQIRDPGTFVIDFTEELNQIEKSSGDQQALVQLMQALSGGAQQPGQPGQLQLSAPEAMA